MAILLVIFLAPITVVLGLRFAAHVTSPNFGTSAMHRINSIELSLEKKALFLLRLPKVILKVIYHLVKFYVRMTIIAVSVSAIAFFILAGLVYLFT